jgi:uncharacterized metal-binding protein YceD (DUF177 family)
MSEFSYLIPTDAIGRSGPIDREASADERAAVAARLVLEALDRLHVTATLERTPEGARLTGQIDAKLVQSCAATGLPLTRKVNETFDLRYLEAPLLADEPDAEVELGDDDCDVLPLEPGGVDVGEAAVQTLALALEPFPRHPDADRILKERGVLSEDQAGPFAALAALRRGG